MFVLDVIMAAFGEITIGGSFLGLAILPWVEFPLGFPEVIVVVFGSGLSLALFLAVSYGMWMLARDEL